MSTRPDVRQLAHSPANNPGVASHATHASHPPHAAHGPHGGHSGHGTHGPHGTHHGSNAPSAPNPHHALYRLPQMGQRHVPVTNFIPVSSDSAPMSKSIRGPSGPASIIPSTLGVGRSSSPSVVMQTTVRQTTYTPTTSTSGYLGQNHRSSGLQITSGVDPHVRYAYPQQGQPTSFASMQRDPAQGFVRNTADRQLTVCELRPSPSHVPPVSNAGNSSHQQRNQIRPPQPVTQQLKSDSTIPLTSATGSESSSKPRPSLAETPPPSASYLHHQMKQEKQRQDQVKIECHPSQRQDPMSQMSKRPDQHYSLHYTMPAPDLLQSLGHPYLPHQQRHQSLLQGHLSRLSHPTPPPTSSANHQPKHHVPPAHSAPPPPIAPSPNSDPITNANWNRRGSAPPQPHMYPNLPGPLGRGTEFDGGDSTAGSKLKYHLDYNHQPQQHHFEVRPQDTSAPEDIGKSVESGAYIRDGHPHGLLHQIHVSSAPVVAAPSSSSGEQPPKRPRIDMAPTPAIATPLTIDTREAVKESIYHPQVEAISPTGPEGSVERDDLKAIKDNLLLEITRVDREILKAESQIAKLKKKQQEVEEASNKPSESSDEIERPKNQSIAQVIYAENRKKARLSHAMLEKFALINNELPLYNQPSDTGIYHANKLHHAEFKKVLVEHFKRKNEEREANERHTTETYTLMSAAWMKKVEKMENSKKRKEKEAKARELYEKIFPELRKQREDKERDHRLGSRGAVRSDADIEDVIERLQEQEMEDKKMHSYAVIPPLLLPPDVRRRKFINTNGLIHDPLKEFNERKFFNVWTDAEKEIFKEKFLLHPKNFGQIAQFLERKTVSDCVQYYYLSKKTENYKQLLRKTKMRRRRGQPQQSDQVISNATGVVTRHRNKNEEKMETNNQDELGGSNRSTPQPSSLNTKHDMKDDRDDDAGERKTTRGRETARNDTSEEDEVPVKNGPYTCAACKTLVDQSRVVIQKTMAVHLGLREDDKNPDVRVCNICYAKALKKKHAYCPVPSCSSTKARGRLRHMPKKWSIIQKELRDVISKEMQLGDGLKKCCPGCFTKINRRINQLMGGNGGSDHAVKQDVPETTWTEDEIEDFKNLLRTNGKNWQLIGEKLCKSAEQSKKFFYDNRKKAHFDKIILEYKKAHPTADQFTPISSDEESGSSTSSGEEDMQTNTAGPSRSNSPASRKANPEPMDTKSIGDMYQSASGSVNADHKVEADDVKIERKSPLVHPSSHRITSREEEYDSSATMSADERESESHPTRTYPFYSGHQLQSNFALQGQVGPRLQHFTTPLDMKRPVFSQGQAPIRIGTGQLVPSPITQVTSNGTRESRAESITVKELMINVIERSLSSVPATTGPAPPPTLDGILESSAKPPIHSRPPYQREITATPPMPARVQSQPGPMAPPPPAVPRPSPHISNDSETLDLSMPKRRDCTPPPTPSLQQGIPLQYKEPVAPLHHARASPPEMYAKSPAPPPAHSANKAKIYSDLLLQNQRIESGPQLGYTITQTDGRRMTTPPHLPARSNPSPGVSHPRAIAPQMPLRPMYSSMPVLRQPSMIPKPPASSPKLQEIERPLTIQTGSITQGTPVSQGHSRGYESLLKVTPPGSSVDKGSITQGTPVYDKKHHLINLPQETSGKTVMYERPATVEFYRKSGQSPVTAPPYPFVPTRQPNYINEPHLSSRQVLMNDYAMARSNEMQRRPESREREQHHAPSPGLLPSPRSRADMRVVPQVDVRSRNDRYELSRSLPEARGDPKADLPSMQHRGDPRAGLEPRQDMRIDLRGRQPQTTMERGEPRLIEPRMHMESRYVPGVAAVVTRPSTSIYQQPMYVGAEGRYLSAATLQRDARSMSPPRVTPPPPRSMGTSATIVPPRSIVTGSMTSGAKQVEILRAHPEVTISKTNSPRHVYSEQNPLNSFVDVVLQQKKLPESKDRPIHLAQQVRMTPYERPKYDAYENHRDRYPQGIPSSSHGSNPEVQLVQQLKTDRSKQLSLLPGDRLLQDRSFTITPGPPPQRLPTGNSELTVKPGPSHIPRPPSNSGRGEQGEPRTVTAASLIDAIITHSINSGPSEAGVASPTVYRCSPEGPGNGDYKLANGPSEAHRSHDHQKELSIAEHVGSYGSKEQLSHPGEDLYLKRRPEPQPHRSATTLMSAPRNAASLVHGDERQITRVERVSPRHQMGQGVEPISPPNHVLHGISPPVPEDPIAKFLESQKRAENKSGALNAPAISPLDYVKNRIVEEMKKGEHTGGEDSKNQANPKRPVEQSASGSPEVSAVGESPRKKMRIENELPDSPGSGEMVIDESARPESVSSQKTASPAPSAQGSSSQGVAVTSAARYEPLSDDD